MKKNRLISSFWSVAGVFWLFIGLGFTIFGLASHEITSIIRGLSLIVLGLAFNAAGFENANEFKLDIIYKYFESDGQVSIPGNVFRFLGGLTLIAALLLSMIFSGHLLFESLDLSAGISALALILLSIGRLLLDNSKYNDIYGGINILSAGFKNAIKDKEQAEKQMAEAQIKTLMAEKIVELNAKERKELEQFRRIFWQKVSEFIPEYKLCRKWPKENQNLLTL